MDAEAGCRREALFWWLTVQDLLRPDLGQHFCLCSGPDHLNTRMKIGKHSRDAIFNVVFLLLRFKLGNWFEISFPRDSDCGRENSSGPGATDLFCKGLSIF